MFPRIRYVLQNQQGEGGAGGNAGAQANGQGNSANANGAQANGSDAAQPSFMTADQFNRAFSERMNRVVSSFEKTIEERLAPLLKRDEKPEAKQGEQGEDPTAAKLKALEKKLAERDEAIAREAAQRSRTEERSTLMNALNAQGITGARANAVAAWLHGEGGRVRRSKDGAVVFAIKRDGYDDELDVAKGVAEWLATDEGKEFAPARQVGGAGTDPKQRGANGQQQKPQRGEALLRALMGGNGNG